MKIKKVDYFRLKFLQKKDTEELLRELLATIHGSKKHTDEVGLNRSVYDAEEKIITQRDKIRKLKKKRQKQIEKLELSANPDDWIKANALKNVVMGLQQALVIVEGEDEV